MKESASVNTESIVFIVENDSTRRMLMMYLAAVGLDARTYCSSEDYLARHEFSKIRHLVLDMQLPGMDGAILQRENAAEEGSAGENTGVFRLIPIKNNPSCESLLRARFACRDVNLNGADMPLPGFGDY